MLGGVDISQIQTEREHKKRDRCLDRKTGQNIAGISTKGRFSCTATEGSTHATVGLGFLRQHYENNEHRNENEDSREKPNKDV